MVGKTITYREPGTSVVNENLKDMIVNYAVKNQPDFDEWFSSLSHEELKSVTCGLLTMYFNDLNSSTLREYVTTLLSGFTPSTEKLGYNGYRDEYPHGQVPCETKPKNIRTPNPTSKLNGSGNFTDLTWEKFDRYQAENPTMLVSGFIDGRMIFIFQFPFTSPCFIQRLKEQLRKRFPDREDKLGEYLRSGDFSFKHYKNDPSLESKCYVSPEDLEGFFQDKYITEPVYKHLRKVSPCLV